MTCALLVLFVLSVLFPNQLFAQARKPTTISELVTYNGKDCEQVLYAGAKSEGKVTWYTSLAGESVQSNGQGVRRQICRGESRSLSGFGLRHDRAHDGGS